MTGLRPRKLLPMALLLALAACSWPRAHANVRLTPDGATVTPARSTTIGGIGVNISQ